MYEVYHLSVDIGGAAVRVHGVECCVRVRRVRVVWYGVVWCVCLALTRTTSVSEVAGTVARESLGDPRLSLLETVPRKQPSQAGHVDTKVRVAENRRRKKVEGEEEGKQTTQATRTKSKSHRLQCVVLVLIVFQSMYGIYVPCPCCPAAQQHGDGALLLADVG